MSLRYIGNKSRLADWLVSIVADHAPEGARVVDPMCGTAAVSAALRAAGYRVVAADVMASAVQNAKVRLLLSEAPAFRRVAGGYADVLRHLNDLEPRHDYVSREFGAAGAPEAGGPPRLYFTAENAARIDAIRLQLRMWSDQGRLSDLERALLGHDLIRATNRVANIAGTYGHFRSSLAGAALRPLELQETPFGLGPIDGHRVLHGRVEDLVADLEADVLYLDPPYNWRQYGANYHLIETIARGDEPPAKGRSGLRPWRDMHSDFCLQRRVEGAFRSVLRAARAPVVIVSYSEDGLLGAERLQRLMAEFGDVECSATRLARFKSNSAGKGGELEELAFVLRRGRVGVRGSRAVRLAAAS